MADGFWIVKFENQEYKSRIAGECGHNGAKLRYAQLNSQMESQQQSQEANQQEQGKCNANVLTIKCKNLEIIHEVFLRCL